MMLNNIAEIKNQIKRNVIKINDYEDVDSFLLTEQNDKYIIFDKIQVKNYLLNSLDNVINCNSSYEKFVNEMNEYYTPKTVFANVKNCNDFAILNLINNTNNIKVD